MKAIGRIQVSPIPTKGNWWRRMVEPKRWELLQPFTVQVSQSLSFTVPSGWSFDFASVPRPCKWLFPDDAIFSYGATIHDYLYKTGPVGKRMADAVFFDALVEIDRVNRLDAWVMWLGVTIGGWPAWLGHRRRDRKRN